MHLPINPLELENRPGQIAWQSGWALDYHYAASFERTRTGEAIYQHKYQGDESQTAVLAEAAAEFIREHKILNRFEIIVSIPPSRACREKQPLAALGAEVSRICGRPYFEHGLRKVKETQELKGIKDRKQREEVLKGAFEANRDVVRGKAVLLLDDVYRSGATLATGAIELRENGESKYVFILTWTKTTFNS